MICFSHPFYLLCSSSFSFLLSQCFLFHLNRIQHSVAQFPLSNLLHTWISNSLVFARILSSFPDHLSHILWDFCICEIIVPCMASLIKTLLSALHSWVSTASSKAPCASSHLLPPLVNSPLKILLTEQFPFLCNSFASNMLAPTPMCTFPWVQKGNRWQLTFPSGPSSESTNCICSHGPSSLLSSVLLDPWTHHCTRMTYLFLWSLPGLSTIAHSHIHLRNIYLDKSQMIEEYKEAEALWLEAETPC